MKRELAQGWERSLWTQAGTVHYTSLEEVARRYGADLGALPMTVRILVEQVARRLDGRLFTEEHLEALVRWPSQQGEVPFQPGRVLMQDLTGVPAVVDLAAMRDAFAALGGDPRRINPLIPVELVIDHSVQVDRFGSTDALAYNTRVEFERNRERYEFLKWASEAFANFTVVPPATGICHQVNLEYLAKVVCTEKRRGRTIACPDTVVGTDSHTTMINGLGVLGWGVGGIEAEAAMLGQPTYLPMPEVVGVRITGALAEDANATDLVLTVTEMLRARGVVEKFVEFFGPGLDCLGLADRATISNMCPEYGATAALFPVDEATLEYLRLTGRAAEHVDLVERYTKAQGLFREAGSPAPRFSDVVELDLGSVKPSVAGPRRPQDRALLSEVRRGFRGFLAAQRREAPRRVSVDSDGRRMELADGAVVIAAITSCTNTSNPSVMVAAGLLAKNAVERGLRTPPHVKTSMAPGSRVVARYLERAGLSRYLEELGFHVVGYGCTTCIGNSGPIAEAIEGAIREGELIAAAVLSGNRNFEGRIHPLVRANYLASPPLVVAYALAGTVDIDLASEPLGVDREGKPVYLRDLWPDRREVERIVGVTVAAELFREEYGAVGSGNPLWNKIRVVRGERYEWQPDSTYIRRPPFFEGLTKDTPQPEPIRGARVLVLLGDSITTDHISPAGAIDPEGPAAQWLRQHGVEPREFNTFGARRGNHEVMMRGTFANLRIRNRLAPGTEGGVTRHLPDGAAMSIYEAAMRYRAEGVPLIVVAGKDYGMGSSRDWAAKGPVLLGVRAVIAESYERIHRSNLIGMGILPLQFLPGENADVLGLTGEELYEFDAVREPGGRLTVRADGKRFEVLVRIDSGVELATYCSGGILHGLLRRLAP